MLHVLTGSAKGRKLKVPKGQKIRPMTSRVKKSVFDTLGDIEGLSVLDIFAGTGGVGIEALSRGAGSVTFVEKDTSVFRILSENVTACGFKENSELICSDYVKAFKKLSDQKLQFDIIFLDPPYPMYKIKGADDLVREANELLKTGGLVIIEHNYKLESAPPGFDRVTKAFGGTFVSYFRKMES